MCKGGLGITRISRLFNCCMQKRRNSCKGKYALELGLSQVLSFASHSWCLTFLLFTYWSYNRTIVQEEQSPVLLDKGVRSCGSRQVEFNHVYHYRLSSKLETDELSVEVIADVDSVNHFEYFPKKKKPQRIDDMKDARNMNFV